MTYSGSMLTPSKLQLHLNGQVIADFGAEGNDVVVGFSCLMAAYYVFSVKYPSKIAKTLLYAEKYLFGLKASKSCATIKRVHEMVLASINST
jgi:hypothetical protein